MTYLDLYRQLPPEALAYHLTCPNECLTRLAPVPCWEKIQNPDSKPDQHKCMDCIRGLLNSEVPNAVLLDLAAQEKMLNDMKPPSKRPRVGDSAIARLLTNMKQQQQELENCSALMGMLAALGAPQDPEKYGAFCGGKRLESGADNA